MKSILKIISDSYLKKGKPYFFCFELTFRCNLKCIHCYIPPILRTKEKELSFDEIKNLLDQAKKMGVIFLLFTGGEIFTRKDILDILDYASKKKFIIYLKTNGALITKDIAEKLSKLKIGCIDVSIYGTDRKTYKNVTGNADAFKKVIRAILYLKRYKIRTMLCYRILKENVNCAARLRDFVKKHGLGTKTPYLLSPRLDGSNKPLCHACFEKEEILKVKKTFASFLPPPKKITDKNKLNQRAFPTGRVCSLLYNGFLIAPFGNVYPCTDVRINLGNARKKKLTEIWYHSRRLKQTRRLNDFKNLKKCQKCDYYKYCRDCLAERLYCTPQSKKFIKIDKYIQSKLKLSMSKRAIGVNEKKGKAV